MIVTSTETVFEKLSGLFIRTEYEIHPPVQSSGAARRAVAERTPDIVLINTPLSDEFGSELACYICEEFGCSVIMLVRIEDADELEERMSNSGVFVVPKPVVKPVFYRALHMTVASLHRMDQLRAKNDSLLSKIEELRAVDRAKCALIQYLGMTEPQAHKFIERQAMNMRKTRAEIADNIIKTYEI